MAHQLTADQEQGLEAILKFMRDPDQRTLMLKGYAGTGKTFLIQEAIKRMGLLNVAFTAPTNKATRVLKDMAIEAGVRVTEVATIYSLLGLVLQPDGAIKVLNQLGNSRAADFHLVVCDEASMINSTLMDYIQMELQTSDIKFIFMGDPLQLPPVGEELSNAFSVADSCVELTTIVRQAADNPIITLTSDIRRAIKEGNRSSLSFVTAKDTNNHGVYVLPKSKWETWIKAGFKSNNYTKDGNYMRVIAWRNVTVDYYNKEIRKALYQEEAANRFIVGEHVLNATPIVDHEEELVLAPIDSEGVIRSVNIIIHPIIKNMRLGEYKVYHLEIGYEEEGLLDAFVLHEDSERVHNQKLQALSAEAKKDRKVWNTFWLFKDSFHDIRPAHSITSHRSQGSTYDNAFVDVGDIFRNNNRIESMKSLYVACSRARYNLMLLT